MAKYAGHPLRHGIVQHGLNDEDITVTLWRINKDDGSRSLVVAAVDIVSADMIKVDIINQSAAVGCTYTIKDPESFWVVVMS